MSVLPEDSAGVPGEEGGRAGRGAGSRDWSLLSVNSGAFAAAVSTEKGPTSCRGDVSNTSLWPLPGGGGGGAPAAAPGSPPPAPRPGRQKHLLPAQLTLEGKTKQVKDTLSMLSYYLYDSERHFAVPSNRSMNYGNALSPS
ncbi:ninja-family protein Os07g0602900-like [Corvus cornix cornix]|uniref:ninja-family protein Os07g0602900-like n=1 Tax=Corvus cornix cornix TaxID=932674 RepID=UPI00194DF640|nr:ninja-family protein Os07g0602900-like [Corvus cornix cornix]